MAATLDQDDLTRPKHELFLDIGLTPRKTVLVAEDEPHIGSLIEDWLSEDYAVELASDGRTALIKAKGRRPDVILMDVMMPDMGGYEVLRALQSDAATRDIPVVVMTARNFDDSTVKMIKREANVIGFLSKPFQRDALREKITQALAGRRTV